MTKSSILPLFTVSDFIVSLNQILEFSFPTVEVEGEVSSFKINQNKYVFFDIKDEGGSIGCFMTTWQLRQPIEDGMKIIVTATPKLTQWGKFSLTVKAIRPVGEGSIKKSFELLKIKLDKEGLFTPERKRELPIIPRHVAVVSSVDAAGYADFIKIINNRWGGMEVSVANVQVQGASAPDQIIRAIKYFNQLEILPEVLVIVRGGGSVDDLATFNDELLVRAIASSRIPTLVGVGHEIDESLADLVADKRASTPSNAAEILVPDKREVIGRLNIQMTGLLPRVEKLIETEQKALATKIDVVLTTINQKIEDTKWRIDRYKQLIDQINPNKVLERGYAIWRGQALEGSMIEVETSKHIMKAEVKNVRQK